MPEKKDYYEVLGVPKDASEKDIKRAYRKLAMKYHPDQSEAPDAEERFKEISEAYAVLSDPEKRKKYDQFGHAGINSQYSQEDLFRGVNFEDLLRGFGFGGWRRASSICSSAAARGRGPVPGRDLRYDARPHTGAGGHRSGDRPSRSPGRRVCPTCRGSGAKPGTNPVSCSNCRGTGQVTRAQNTPFGQMVTSTACPKCGGRGQIITSPLRGLQRHGKGAKDPQDQHQDSAGRGGRPAPQAARPGRCGTAREESRRPLRGHQCHCLILSSSVWRATCSWRCPSASPRPLWERRWRCRP